MKNFYIYIILIFSIFLSTIIFIDKLIKTDNKLSLKSTYLKSNSEIEYNEFGIPIIKNKSKFDQYYLLGIAHSKDRMLQLDYNLSLYLGKVSERYNQKKWKLDYVARRLEIEEKAKEIFYQKSKEVQKKYIAYVSGINDFFNSQKENFQLSVFKVNALKWQPWYPVIFEIFEKIANNNLFQELQDFRQLFPLEDINPKVFPELIESADFEHNFDLFFGLKSDYLNLLSNYFNSLPKFSFEDIAFSAYSKDSTKYYFYSQKGDLFKNNEAYLSILNDKINLSIPGNPFSLCEIDSTLHLFDNYDVELKINRTSIINEKITVNDSVIKFKYGIDTLQLNTMKSSYLFKSEHYNIINYKDHKNILSINIETKQVKSQVQPSENLIINNRINELINNAENITPIEIQLISNDNYSNYYKRLRNIFIQNIRKFDKVLSESEKKYVENLEKWACFIDPNEKTTSYFQELKRAILDDIFKNFDPSIEIDLTDKTADKIIINSLTYFPELFDDPKTLEIETLDQYIFQFFKKTGIDSFSVINNYLETESLSSRIDSSFSFFQNEFNLKGDRHSIRYNAGNENKSANLANIIFDEKRKVIYYQNYSGQSGNRLSKNYSDLFSIWKTGGYIKSSLNNNKIDSKIELKIKHESN